MSSVVCQKDLRIIIFKDGRVLRWDICLQLSCSVPEIKPLPYYIVLLIVLWMFPFSSEIKLVFSCGTQICILHIIFLCFKIKIGCYKQTYSHLYKQRMPNRISILNQRSYPILPGFLTFVIPTCVMVLVQSLASSGRTEKIPVIP